MTKEDAKKICDLKIALLRTQAELLRLSVRVEEIERKSNGKPAA